MPKTRRRKQKGGMTSRLDIPIETFLSSYSTYYIGGHGSIPLQSVSSITSPTKGFQTFQVPPNTYILHVAPSGQKCGSIDDEDAILRSITYDLDTISNKSNQSKVQQRKDKSLINIHKLLSGVESDRDVLGYKKRIYIQSPAGGGGGGGSVSVSANDQLTGIYEPGDIVPDLSIVFRNKPESIIDIGVLKAPFNYKFFDRIGTMREELSTLTEDQKVAYVEQSDQELLRYPDNVIGSEFADLPRANRLKRLSEILNDAKVEPTAEKPFRVFIIFACRSILQASGNVPNAIKKYIRRRSISQRHSAKLANKFAESIPGYTVLGNTTVTIFEPLTASSSAATAAATSAAATAAATSAAATAPALPIGTQVVIYSFEGNPEYNGLKGTITNSSVNGGSAAVVELYTGKKLSVPIRSIAIIPDIPPRKSAFVVPFDLTNKVLVGKVGQVTGINPNNPSRLGVKFPSEDQIKSILSSKLAVPIIQDGL